jgi:hypothetical protein
LEVFEASVQYCATYHKITHFIVTAVRTDGKRLGPEPQGYFEVLCLFTDEGVSSLRELKWREGGENCMPRRMMWAVHVARMGEKRTAYKLLVGKPEETSTRKS